MDSHTMCCIVAGYFPCNSPDCVVFASACVSSVAVWCIVEFRISPHLVVFVSLDSDVLFPLVLQLVPSYSGWTLTSLHFQMLLHPGHDFALSKEWPPSLPGSLPTMRIACLCALVVCRSRLLVGVYLSAVVVRSWLFLSVFWPPSHVTSLWFASLSLCAELFFSPYRCSSCLVCGIGSRASRRVLAVRIVPLSAWSPGS